MSWWVRFILAVLATWRVTHLLANEDGPADVIVRLRALLGQSLAGKLMDCFHCLSLWIAAPMALFVDRSPLQWLFAWLALSGGACLLERLVIVPVVIESVARPGRGEMDYVLRFEAHATEEQPAPGDNGGRPFIHPPATPE